MDQKMLLKILAVMLVVGVLLVLFAPNKSATSPTIDENLEGNMTDETRKVNDDIVDEKPRSIAFEHTNPGVSSEIYYTVGNLEPGTMFTATLFRRPAADFDYIDGKLERTQEVMVDGFGVARFVWEINEFGDYGVSDDIWGIDMVMETIMVE